MTIKVTMFAFSTLPYSIYINIIHILHFLIKGNSEMQTYHPKASKAYIKRLQPSVIYYIAEINEFLRGKGCTPCNAGTAHFFGRLS